MKDDAYMSRAVALAKNGIGHVNPNPLVGAVIVKDDRIIGEGWHEKYGGLHAERNAFKNCVEEAEGATLYVTLEPCCHYGKTPPCTEAIIEHKIARVVIGILDPNPLMSGKSVALLRTHGIEVEVGILEKECLALTRIFRKYITTKKPYVLAKYAMTMDGKIATHTGASKWITGEAARRSVQETRKEFSAIMAGIRTVLCDDPMLNCRIEKGCDPVRVICDTHLQIPLTSKIVQSAKTIQTIIACGSSYDTAKKAALEAQHCEILELPGETGMVDLAALMSALGERGIDSVLIEGGGSLNWSAFSERLVDAVQAYIAPKIFGGTAASPVSGTGVDLPEQAVQLVNSTIRQIGEDYLIESEVKYPCLQES